VIAERKLKMEWYKEVNGKKLRRGYTTGSCAAAAARGAVLALTSDDTFDLQLTIDIDIPIGIKINIPVNRYEKNECEGLCSIIKDGGDDPDVTNGIEIVAVAKFTQEPGVTISAGEGIGTVTKKGLLISPGNPAINPVPLKMIFHEIQKVLPQKGIEITLSVPNGREVAQKTFNPRLGIMGGISILGTTGIVEPMSEESMKTSLALELSVLKAQGHKTAVFVPGNYGSDFARNKLNIPCDKIIKTSNFIGFMIDSAVELEFHNILMVGHIGKLIKVAAGIFNTHSQSSDARNEAMAAYAALHGAPKSLVEQIFISNSTEEAVEIIRKNELDCVLEFIAQRITEKCTQRSHNKIKFGTVLFSMNQGFLAADENAEKIIKELGTCTK